MKDSQPPDNILPVILAGGSGTRLWPLSRELYPKQFLRLVGERTMLQHTLGRLDGLAHDAPLIVCNNEHRFVVAEQCRECGVEPGAILLEPAPRNTAPAVALAALHGIRDGDDPVLLVLPADHHIGSVDAFEAAVRTAIPFAQGGAMVVFGIQPSGPETGYGYIQADEAQPTDGDVASVSQFTEKPSRAVAEKLLADGGWYWNSGMFLFRASAFLGELEALRPDIHGACVAAAEDERRDLEFRRPGDAFLDCPAESVDRAVMEHTDRGVVVRADMDWSDIGTWDALAGVLDKDADGNTTEGDVMVIDSRDSHLSGRGRLVAAVGVDGLVVVETPDAVLVANKGRAQQVARAVERLRDESRSEHRQHTTDYRPWGHAETLQVGDGFLVKRITVAPGRALSLQMHNHRSEHWVVVRGEAEVVRGDEQFTLAPDESTYIPVGTRHRLTNRGSVPLEVIEIQTGDRLSEDDIVRFEDRYARR